MQRIASTPDFSVVRHCSLRVNPGPRNKATAGPEGPVCMPRDLGSGNHSWLERVKCAPDLTSPMMGI